MNKTFSGIYIFPNHIFWKNLCCKTFWISSQTYYVMVGVWRFLLCIINFSHHFKCASCQRKALGEPKILPIDFYLRASGCTNLRKLNSSLWSVGRWGVGCRSVGISSANKVQNLFNMIPVISSVFISLYPKL